MSLGPGDLFLNFDPMKLDQANKLVVVFLLETPTKKTRWFVEFDPFSSRYSWGDTSSTSVISKWGSSFTIQI